MIEPFLTEKDYTERDDLLDADRRQDEAADRLAEKWAREERIETAVILLFAVATVVWSAFLTVGTLYLMGEIQ